MNPHQCSICKRRFKNHAGLKGHQASLKDAAHVAHRTRSARPRPQPSPPEASYVNLEPSPTLPSRVGPGVDPPEGPPRRDPKGFPPPDPNPGPSLEGSPAAEPTIDPAAPMEVALAPPATTGPLLTEATPPIATRAAGANPAGDVDLKPFIAGTVALTVNAFLLAGPRDGKLLPEDVAASGLPQAVEVCLRTYFPTLDPNHPLSALIVSAVTLALLVVAKRAPKASSAPPRAQESTPASAPAPLPTSGSHDPGALATDPYWDALLRSLEVGGGA